MSITDAEGNEFAKKAPIVVDVQGNEFVKKTPKVVDVIPCGTQVLVELLKAEDIIGNSKIVIADNVKAGGPQAFVLKVGKNTDAEAWGFKIGDRVIISGNGIPVDDSACVATKEGRSVVLLEPSAIKAILIEG